MKFLFNTILFLAIIPIVTSCESQVVEKELTNILTDVFEGNDENVLLSFDAQSQKYFDRLLDAIRENNVAKANYLGSENDVLISTLIIFDQFVSTDDQVSDSVRVGLASQGMLDFVLITNQAGIFRNSQDTPIRIHEGAKVSRNRADISVTVSTGTGAKLATSFIMRKEEGKWKLNFPSTMRVLEKIYAQGLPKSGLTSYQYAQQLNKSLGNEISFQYDRNYRE